MNQDNIQSGTDVFDVLSQIDLSAVDTSRPLLAPGIYTMQIKEGSMSREQSKTKEGTYLKLTLVTTEEAETVNEKLVSPGFPLTHIISLVKTDNYDPLQNIARFHAALGLQDVPFDATFAAYDGREVVCRINVSQEKEDPNTGDVYPAQNRVAAFIPSSD